MQRWEIDRGCDAGRVVRLPRVLAEQIEEACDLRMPYMFSFACVERGEFGIQVFPNWFDDIDAVVACWEWAMFGSRIVIRKLKGKAAKIQAVRNSRLYPSYPTTLVDDELTPFPPEIVRHVRKPDVFMIAHDPKMAAAMAIVRPDVFQRFAYRTWVAAARFCHYSRLVPPPGPASRTPSFVTPDYIEWGPAIYPDGRVEHRSRSDRKQWNPVEDQHEREVLAGSLFEKSVGIAAI